MATNVETQQLKIVVLGNPGVGKTSLLNRYVKKEFTHRYRATIGADFLAGSLEVDGTQVDLQLWDTAGQERFRSLGLAFYRGADCCVLVFDLTSHESFSGLETWIEEFLEKASPLAPESYPFIIMGNKCDLAESRLVSSEVIEKWISLRGYVYHEVSAKDDINVNQAFEEGVRLALERGKAHYQVNSDIRILRNTNPKQNKGCCS